MSHSGALGFSSVFARAYDRAIGFRYVVSTGNECDLNASDVLRHFVEDSQTRVIAAMLEGLRDPAGFREAAIAAASAGKPIVVLKNGRSEKGRQAALAHTGALAGSDAVHDAVFKHHGVLRVDDVDDLWEVSSLLESVRPPAGRRVGVITTTGGLNGLLADHLRREGLELPDFAPATKAALGEFLPYFSSNENPLDLTAFFAGGPSETAVFQRALALLDQDDGIDIIVMAFVVMRTSFDDVLLPIMESIRACQKPVVVLSTGGSMSDSALAPLRGSGIPLFGLPSRCARALRHLCDYADFQRRLRAEMPRTVVSRELPDSPTHPAGLLDPRDARELLDRYGIAGARQAMVATIDEAETAAARIGYPIVLKALGPGIIHKSDHGAVVLGISDVEDLRREFPTLLQRLGPSWILVQEMVRGGVEMIVGLHADRQFGPVVLVGVGGIFVEQLNDVTLRPIPVTRSDVLRMIDELHGRPLLDGVRGNPPADIDALVEVVQALSRLGGDVGDRIESIDLNPVVVLPKGGGCRVIDERVIWRAGPESRAAPDAMTVLGDVHVPSAVRMTDRRRTE